MEPIGEPEKRQEECDQQEEEEEQEEEGVADQEFTTGPASIASFQQQEKVKWKKNRLKWNGNGECFIIFNFYFFNNFHFLLILFHYQELIII